MQHLEWCIIHYNLCWCHQWSWFIPSEKFVTWQNKCQCQDLPNNESRVCPSERRVPYKVPNIDLPFGKSRRKQLINMDLLRMHECISHASQHCCIILYAAIAANWCINMTLKPALAMHCITKSVCDTMWPHLKRVTPESDQNTNGQGMHPWAAAQRIYLYSDAIRISGVASPSSSSLSEYISVILAFHCDLSSNYTCSRFISA